ncbi:MAG: substrate-binding and VWA domain-containing protein [Proteobacteria bacterium]|nr:substrate-binding and VWA domain-containing protein [Pseudomonadota bacterium]
MNTPLRFILYIFAALMLSGCDGQKSASESLTVLAGSELKDMEPLLGEIENKTGIKLQMTYSGTLDGAEKLIAGEPTDLAWFSHGKYITLVQGDRNRILAQEKTMLSPVLLGVKESAAKAWGWSDNPKLTWRDIAAKAESGELRYAMADPASSNSGFTALVGVATALSGSSDALAPKDIDQAQLGGFFKGQQLSAGSSGWLTDAFVKEQARLNGIINYESVLMTLNRNQRLDEQLVLIYPQEGIITADYPLMLINGEKREAYNKLVAYLTSPEFQQKMMEQTLRRPVIPQVKLSAEFATPLLVELAFPNDLAAIDKLLFAYEDKHRRSSHAYFVLDVSGSMAGARMQSLQTALKNLTGQDQTLSGRFSRFRSRETLTFIPFDNQVYPAKTFTINDPASQGADMQAVRAYIDSLQPKGQTGIYQALQAAYRMALEARHKDPDRFYSIVLMTDGENNAGLSEDGFAQFIAALAPQDRGIKTFTILFGDASQEGMKQLAEITEGRLFDGRESLNQAFKTIRGYQ